MTTCPHGPAREGSVLGSRETKNGRPLLHDEVARRGRPQHPNNTHDCDNRRTLDTYVFPIGFV